MNERSYTTVDKTEWGDGPWTSEPDKVVWIDETTGLDCLAHRGPMGNWCGYVGVPPGHPDHGRDYSELDLDVSVHGGLTYADPCQQGASEEEGICHVPEPGRPGDVWWFGFDCGHFQDLMPGLRFRERQLGVPMPQDIREFVTYKPLAYVRDECEALAGQLADRSAHVVPTANTEDTP